MQSVKNVLKSALWTLCFFLGSTLVLTILNYFNVFDYKVINIIKIIIPILSFGFGGFITGKKTLKNGWLEGIKLSSFLSFNLIIICLVLKSFKFNYLIYIFVLTAACIFGSMIGINKK